jgi:hypothetical protein
LKVVESLRNVISVLFACVAEDDAIFHWNDL